MAFSDPFDTPRREASNLTVSTKKRVGEQRNQTRTRNMRTAGVVGLRVLGPRGRSPAVGGTPVAANRHPARLTQPPGGIPLSHRIRRSGAFRDCSARFGRPRPTACDLIAG